jgi:hypothetical protein
MEIAVGLPSWWSEELTGGNETAVGLSVSVTVVPLWNPIPPTGGISKPLFVESNEAFEI